jgi:hypothetical protein
MRSILRRRKVLLLDHTKEPRSTAGLIAHSVVFKGCGESCSSEEELRREIDHDVLGAVASGDAGLISHIPDRID